MIISWVQIGHGCVIISQFMLCVSSIYRGSRYALRYSLELGFRYGEGCVIKPVHSIKFFSAVGLNMPMIKPVHSRQFLYP